MKNLIFIKYRIKVIWLILFILNLNILNNIVVHSQPCTAINMGTLFPDTIEQYSGTVPSGNVYNWNFYAVAGFSYSFYNCALLFNNQHTPNSTLVQTGFFIYDNLWNIYGSGLMYCGLGSTITLNCSISGVYYIWLSGDDSNPCNYLTGQQSIGYITDYYQPPEPLISANSDTIRCGSILTLLASNVIGNVYWYKSSCSGTNIGTGDSLNYYNSNSPVTNTIYYARNNYNNVFSNCKSITIYTDFAPLPVSVFATPLQLSCGDSTSLNATSFGYSIKWFNQSSGSFLLGTSESGSNFVIIPNSTITYYAEAYSGGSGNQLFNFTGNVQFFNIPTGINLIIIDASGAEGFGVNAPGGLGGRVQTNLKVIPGQLLYIFVGEQGLSCDSGGWNGGAFSSCSNLSPIYNIGTGGGASDIRIGGTSLTKRVIVAGGGGGGGYCGVDNNGALFFGGSGGGLIGSSGSMTICDTGQSSGAYGGTQNSGGSGGYLSGYGSGMNGTFGIGGEASSFGSGGGGGGGYYGGGGGFTGGGGGGSSYTDSLLTTNTINTQGYQNGNGYVIISWNAPLCYSSTRASVTVTVQAATAPTVLTVTPTTITCSGSTSLTGISTSNIIRWWDASIGGNILGTSQNSNNLTVYPTITTTYYAETFNSCTGNLRASITVTVNPIPLPTQVIAIPTTICIGTSCILNAGSTGNFIKWWNSSTGGAMLGTSSNNANFAVFPSTTTTYYAEASTDSISIIKFNYVTSSIITWVVPSGVNLITIDARGASGGYTSGSTAGKGARIVGTFSVNQGDTLSLLVGQCPGLYNGTYSGGGGGTYAAHGSNIANATLLIAAGGGSGAGNLSTGIDAPITNNGTGLNPGTNGNGAPASACSGGGGGFYSSGANDVINGFYGGQGFRQGGAGGTAPLAYVSNYQSGGFGGGATGDYQGACHSFAGSGGGYSGGSGTTGNIISYGQAGGSYNGGSNQLDSAGYNTGNGQIIISWQLPLCVSARISVTVTVGSITTPIVSALSATICSGNSTNLFATGNGLIKWWDSPTGGNLLDTTLSGGIFTVTPSITATYYADLTDSCGTSQRISLTITVNLNSLPANSISPTYLTICSSTIDTLSVSGGFLSGNANWYWYTGSCGSTLSGIGNKINVNPSLQTEYFVRAECLCNTTICVSTTISINTSTPSPPALASTDRNNYCSNAGGNIVLSVSGGSGTTLTWYKYSCGGTFVGTGISKTILAPGNTITYFAKWGTPGCGNTPCVSRTVTVLLTPVVPFLVSSSGNNLCSNSGGNILLNQSGGTGVTFGWYTGTCGGLLSGTGKNLSVVSPTITITYWGRWETVSCGVTACKSITITVIQAPVSPIALTANRSNYCSDAGGNITLITSGGNGIIAGWYTGSCNSILSGTGDTLTLPAPTSTTVFYSNMQTPGCNNTACISITITVYQAPVPPSAALVDRNLLCFNGGGTINLSLTGGSGTYAEWYTSGCGSITIGTGNPFSINAPNVATTYYVNFQTTGCANSTCKSVSVDILSSLPLQPDTIIGNINPVAGNLEFYNVAETSGINYSWSIPSGWSGSSTTNSITILIGQGSGIISVTPSNVCGNGRNQNS